MSEVNATKTFPKMPSKNWWDLRRRFQKSVPRVVDRDYVQSVLGLQSEKAAGNILAPLKALGLIDSEGKPTDLAHDWRSDDAYSTACKKIFDALYPSALIDAFPAPNPDSDGVRRWFARNAGVGDAAAQQMTQMYLLLAKADLAMEEAPVAAPVGNRVRPAKATTAPRLQKVGATRPTQPPKPTHADGPPVHVDIQIHIGSDASSDQIDAIFASMAKHLYS
jgi:hypothetical protein